MAKSTPKDSASRSSIRRVAAPTLALRPVGREVPAFPAYTRDQVERLVDDTSDFVRRTISVADASHEAIAERIFKDVFLNSPRLALDSRASPPGFAELVEREGASLELDTGEVRDYARIAALNHHVRDKLWVGLSWAMKLALLPLTRNPDSLLDFRDGVLIANQPNLGVRHVRDWVQKAKPQTDETPGPRRGLTLVAGEKVNAAGVRLGDEDERAQFVDRVVAAPEERREKFVSDLEETVKNLQKVLSEISAKSKGKERR